MQTPYLCFYMYMCIVHTHSDVSTLMQAQRCTHGELHTEIHTQRFTHRHGHTDMHTERCTHNHVLTGCTHIDASTEMHTHRDSLIEMHTQRCTHRDEAELSHHLVFPPCLDVSHRGITRNEWVYGMGIHCCLCCVLKAMSTG